MLPIATSDFSATLIKAKAYKPNVLLNNMGGLAQINCMKQFTQFGMQNDMALGGALFELESDPVGAEGGAGRLVGHGMVVGPARRAARRRVRRRVPQGDAGKTPSRAPLVRLCRHALVQDRRRKGQEPGRHEDGARRWRTWSCRPKWRCSPARSPTAPATTN